MSTVNDMINHPNHYNWAPVECLEIAEHYSFDIGNTIKYVYRRNFKDSPLKDLLKAEFYLNRAAAEAVRTRQDFVSSNDKRLTDQACIIMMEHDSDMEQFWQALKDESWKDMLKTVQNQIRIEKR